MRAWPAWFVLVAGCGNPCEAYVDAVLDCYADAGRDPAAGADVGTQCPDDTTKQSKAYYQCVQDAWSNGDCSTEAGLQGIHDEAAACTPD